MFRILALLFALLLPSLATAVPRSTAEERLACTGDALRFCSQYVPSRPAIIACLQAHWREISLPCRALVSPRRIPVPRPRPP